MNMLSFIVPVYNEAESLPQLHQEIRAVCQENRLAYELLFVDDGSTDGSWSVIEKLRAEDPNVFAIRFRRNFGKAAALTAGMKVVRGDTIFMMDADLQDDPKEIPRFLAKLNEGYDVVNGWKVRRLDPWHKVYPSKVFNWLVGWLTGLRLHDHNCGFKCFRAEVAKEINIYGELHRFVPVLAFSRGFRVSEIEVHHRKRQFGKSKYGFKRFTRGFLDLLTVKFLIGYGQRPQHLLGQMGLLCFGMGFLGLFYLAAVWLMTNVLHPLIPALPSQGPIGTRPMLSYSVTITVVGVQLLSLGLLAELLVSRTSREVEQFSIRESHLAGGDAESE